MVYLPDCFIFAGHYKKSTIRRKAASQSSALGSTKTILTHNNIHIGVDTPKHNLGYSATAGSLKPDIHEDIALDIPHLISNYRKGSKNSMEKNTVASNKGSKLKHQDKHAEVIKNNTDTCSTSVELIGEDINQCGEEICKNATKEQNELSTPDINSANSVELIGEDSNQCCKKVCKNDTKEQNELPTPDINSTRSRNSEKNRIIRGKQKHPMRPGCKETCQKSCHSFFTTEDRRNIWTEFWSMSYNDRKQFIRNNVIEHDKKRQTTENSRRHKSRTFKFKDSSGSKKQVCKVFFLETLGHKSKNDQIITTALQRPQQDQRGKHPKINKINRNIIHLHIKTYMSSVSQQRKTFQSKIKTMDMYKDYIRKNPKLKCCYELYRSEVLELGLNFN